MQKKYQVFISSTFSDLIDERQDALKSVLDMGHIPSGMEAFPAVDLEQFEYIKKIIDECDYYILIVGARYGSVDDAGVSFTEKEYHYAVSTKKTVLAFLHNDLGSVPVAKTDGDKGLQAKLETFRKIVAKGRLVQFWSAREDLRSKVIVSLHKAMSDYPATGWMRADAAASEDLLAQINKLRVENEDLRSKTVLEIEDSDPENLADVDSTFVIRYAYDAYSARASSIQTLYASVVLSWKAIFVLVAPQFRKPRSGGIHGAKVRELMCENRLIPPERGAAQLFQVDLNTIEIQLRAYGFISSEIVSGMVSGAEQYTQLTSLGRRRQLQWSTVNAATPE
jgi:hypothetical protein